MIPKNIIPRLIFKGFLYCVTLPEFVLVKTVPPNKFIVTLVLKKGAVYTAPLCIQYPKSPF